MTLAEPWLKSSPTGVRDLRHDPLSSCSQVMIRCGAHLTLGPVPAADSRPYAARAEPGDRAGQPLDLQLVLLPEPLKRQFGDVESRLRQILFVHTGYMRGALRDRAPRARTPRFIRATPEPALETAEHGIRVKTVAPGPIQTPMIDEFVASSSAETDPMEALREAHPMGRIGRVGEVTGAILYLAYDVSSFTIGSAVMVDGGYIAR